VAVRGLTQTCSISVTPGVFDSGIATVEVTRDGERKGEGKVVV
jgi:hypothetical protein